MAIPAVQTFSPGFRLSRVDGVVLIAGAVGAIVLGRFDRWPGIAIAFVVGHFFLFCNILRMSRPPELIWAGAFAALIIAVTAANALSWPVALGASAALTIVLCAIELRRPSYHGAGWRKVNPRLPEWWSQHTGNA